ncbi:Isochorismatase family protein YecD [Beijerinckiaceae bacterium RH AL1]|nr:hydrolase [Beijerinckiaceae bacterium]VVB49038.1 Isochorismatase family protein YecD [Beijerinckiaceae bacterium RH CH11]VVB49117.1 Isochorismatase family protein YecD [Beijerinckiaceae bacterium RH AL8]VVC56696.1 Isochorismatase family protein YecD [Beijerinckiaceae bacterium RH AL1]
MALDTPVTLDPKRTALVLIDLQNGIVGMPTQPRSGADTLAAGKALAERFRAAGAPVVLVNVAFAPDFADAPPSNVDEPMRLSAGGLPEGWSELAPGLAQASDIRVTKRNWGAFHGTELDTVLRRRGVTTIVLGGIATNMGVEGTAREAWAHGYDLVVVEDATSGVSTELHEMAFRHILPRLGRVRSSAAVQFAHG